jgi:Asp-tRNA(Asn)/Glu-tRNA(Gln) amidotransferase A subunit family amidase
MVWAARLPAGPGHPGAAHHSRAAVTADGLAIELQIVGRRLDDVLVLRASAAYEAARHGETAGPDPGRIRV